MSSQFSPPVGMPRQWAPRGPSQHNQMGQNNGWHGQPAHGSNSGAYGRNQNNNYGWQGHQPKYSIGNSNDNYNHKNYHGQNSNNPYNHYNNQGSRPRLSCEPCGMTFGSTEIMKEHMEEHVQCPFPECRMNACIKVMDQHITNQHILVNFADLQIDNEQWIAQRKKRFPTAERAKIRREQQMEMILRGQKIGLEKRGLKKDNKFDKFDKFDKKNKYENKQSKYENKSVNNDHGKSSEIDKNKETFNGKKRESYRDRRERIKKEKREKFLKREKENNKLSKSFTDVDVYDSDSEVKFGLPAFKGTKLFYEEIGLISYFINTKNEEVLSGENDIAISDEEEWNITEVNVNNNNKDDNNSKVIDSSNSNATNGSSKLVLGNALGSLIGAYDSDSEENEENKNDLPQSETKTKEISSTKEVDENIVDGVNEERENNSDPKNHLEPETENSEGNGTKRRRNRKHRRHRNKGEEISTKDVSESGKVSQKHVKPKRPPPVKRRRPTLLMRLLEADIRHERNIILQCIRHIVVNNFFEEVIECESDEELTENGQQGDDTNINNTALNGENETTTVSNDDFQIPTKSAPKRKADNPVKSSKAKEAKLVDALTEFHKKNFDRVARNMFADDDEDGVTSVEDYLNMKK